MEGGSHWTTPPKSSRPDVRELLTNDAVLDMRHRW